MYIERNLTAEFNRMNDISNDNFKPVGLPPGSIVHTGEEGKVKCKITMMCYDEKEFFEKELENIEDCIPLLIKKNVTWVNIDGVHDTDVIARAGTVFGFHPLVLEDIAHTEQRPKFDDYEDYYYIVLKMLQFDESCVDDDKICSEQVSIILSKNFVVTFQETEGDVFNIIRERIRTAKGRIRKMGNDYLTYCLMDAITDFYFVILEKIGDNIEIIEEEMLEQYSPQTIKKIYELKRQAIFLRKAVWPLRELIAKLMRSESKIITKTTQLYLRDLYDHTVQIIDNIESERDVISGLLDIYLSSLSNRMNEVMKVLTIISTIFIPLTFIAGIYGMNFNTASSPFNMPELNWKYGYFFCLFLMAVIAITMLIFFKKKKWI